MDNFKAVYKILSALEKAMDYPEFDMKRDITGATRINASDVRITLKGLEYLQENSMMKKVYNAVKGIKDITPGL